MGARERVKGLVEEARTLLSEESKLYTDGWRMELLHMTELAQAALEGESVPFVRSRAFYEPREDDDILHAERYFSRAPSFASEFYGLASAIEDFKKSRADLRLDELKAAMKRYRAEIEAADTSGKIGSYDKAAAADALRAIDAADHASDAQLPAALVEACNAVRRFKGTRVFRQDVEETSNLFLTEQGRKCLLAAIENGGAADAFQRIKELSEYYSADRALMLRDFMRIDIDYQKMNQRFFIWSTTDKVITFHTPASAQYARLRFILPKEENEENGLGHIWLDNVRVCAGSGGDWQLNNSGFDDVQENIPVGWSPVSEQGSPILKSVSEYPYCGEGECSIYIENPTDRDAGGWEYDAFIPIEADTECTVMFLAKIDGKFKKGIKIEIEFLDAVKNHVGEFTYYYNRKSVVREKAVALTMQADAIMYYLTGNREYAQKAKNEFLYVLSDFCQGMETWFAYDKRPDGCDAYGAVQGGRVMCSLMSAYTLIKEASIFSGREWDMAVRQLKYMASYLYDGRPRGEMTPEAVQSYAYNWQTDMACGIGFLVMAMPKTTESAIILDSVNYFLKSQLTINLGKDGSWPESIRYHFAALKRFAVYAKVLKHVTGEDWFRDTPLADMFYYPIMVQTPPYAYMGGNISTPTIGDHILGDGEEFSFFSIYFSDVYSVNPTIGAAMKDIWLKSGARVPKFGAEDVLMSSLSVEEQDIAPCAPELKSTGHFRDSGIYIMRGQREYCAVMAPYKHIGHGHYDAGSMIIYYDNVPVVIDPGIEGYFDSTKDWYVSSSAHSVMQFAREGGKKQNPDPFDINLEKTEYSAVHGWVDVAREVEVENFSSDGEKDNMIIKIRNPEGKGTHTRSVTWMKEQGYYIVKDTVHGFDSDLRFSLVTAMREVAVEGNKVHCKGYFDVDMEVEFVGGAPKITIENGRVTNQFPHEGTPYAKIIRAVDRGGFTVIVRPHRV